MQKENSKASASEEKVDLVIGIIVTIVVLGLFAWLLISIGNGAKSSAGTISADGQPQRGVEQTLTYNVNSTRIKDGDKVVWTVNGKKVGQSTYKKGTPITLNYTPDVSGNVTVRASVGKYSKTTSFDVAAPQLTVTAPNLTVTYGDQIPEMRYTIDGFIDGEDANFDYDGCCVVDSDKLDVGVYTINFDKECNYLDYQTEYVCGTLTVLPKRLNVRNQFAKVYDGTNTIDTPEISLDGIIEGDEVHANCDKLYFDNKNVGINKQIMLANVCLSGKNAVNYVLCDNVYGQITPKQVDVVGLTVKDKTYDGTTKATIDTMGTLQGVCKGDSVAIGKLSVSFDKANVGEQSFTATEITLVGADKDNYVINKVESGTAKITTSLFDRLLQKEPLAQGNN